MAGAIGEGAEATPRTGIFGACSAERCSRKRSDRRGDRGDGRYSGRQP